jgi:hypothetical protein
MSTSASPQGSLLPNSEMITNAEPFRAIGQKASHKDNTAAGFYARQVQHHQQISTVHQPETVMYTTKTQEY